MAGGHGFLCGVAAAAVMAGASHAETVFGDRNAFAAAAGAVTLVDFNDIDTAPDDYVYYPASLTLSGVTFTPVQGEMYVTDPAFYGTAHYGEGAFLEVDYGEPDIVTISFAPARSFGFDYQYLSPPLIVQPAPFHLEFSNGRTFDATTSYSFSQMDPLAFFGVVTDDPFQWVRLTLPDFGMYNVTDNFRVGAPVASAAPEPGTWALVVLGAGLAGAAIRRRKATPARQGAPA